MEAVLTDLPYYIATVVNIGHLQPTDVMAHQCAKAVAAVEVLISAPLVAADMQNPSTACRPQNVFYATWPAQG